MMERARTKSVSVVFEVQGEKDCKKVLDLVLAREIMSCRELLGDLEMWTHELKSMTGNESGVIVPLIGSLKAQLSI